MGAEANKELVRRFYTEAINARDLSAVDRLHTEDFVHNGQARGREGQRAAVQAFLDGFSDLRNEILLMLGEDDLVAAHQRWRGTNDGAFAGTPASGKAVEFTSTAVLRIAGDQIAEAWDEVDMLGLTSQLSG